MDIGIIVFAYNRSHHLKRVLDGLKQNKGVSKLYIFQDGLKCEEHRSEWEKTKRVIQETDWCEVAYTQSDNNKGLANSVVDGISAVLEETDGVVVLEDDCVPHPLFIPYVTRGLEKYRKDQRVFAINGYAWNLKVDGNGTDAYFAGRFGSWGWATWKDRWELYERDYKILARIRKDPQKQHRLDTWAQDAVSSLVGNVYGTCDSWAVFWGLKCIELGKFCLTPYRSLIENIGFDGSGVHCGNTAVTTEIRDWTDIGDIILPETVEPPGNCEAAFTNEFWWTTPETKLSCYNRILLQWNMLLHKGGSIADYFLEQDIHCIAVWGKGNLCKALLHEMQDKITVKYIIESRTANGWYEGIPVINHTGITDDIQLIVIIPVYDMERIQKGLDESLKKRLIGIDRILEKATDGYMAQENGGKQ